jgi:hypothetical protein
MISMCVRLFLCVPFYAIVSLAASSCGSPQVVSLPLRDIQVLPDIKDSYMRGIALKAGNPAQDLVVLPWA